MFVECLCTVYDKKIYFFVVVAQPLFDSDLQQYHRLLIRQHAII